MKLLVGLKWALKLGRQMLSVGFAGYRHAKGTQGLQGKMLVKGEEEPSLCPLGLWASFFKPISLSPIFSWTPVSSSLLQSLH